MSEHKSAQREVLESDGITTINFRLDGKLHREDGPAVEQYKDGLRIYESWIKHGEYHRTDGPAVQKWVNGQLTEQYWMQNHQKHRLDGPTYLIWDRVGNLKWELWHQNNLSHREGGPAAIHRHTNGQIEQATWYQNDHRDRRDGPAIQNWDSQGNLTNEEWWVDGRSYHVKPTASLLFLMQEIMQTPNFPALLALLPTIALAQKDLKIQKIVDQQITQNIKRLTPPEVFQIVEHLDWTAPILNSLGYTDPLFDEQTAKKTIRHTKKKINSSPSKEKLTIRTANLGEAQDISQKAAHQNKSQGH